MKQDQKRNGSFHFLPVLQGYKTLSYYSVLRHALDTLKPSKTSKKEEIMILAGDARSKLGYIKKKTASSEPIITELLQDLRSAGKNPTPLCANSVLQRVYLL